MATDDPTSAEQAFAEAFQRYGPRTPDIEPSGPVTSYYPRNPFPGIYFGLVDTDELNAMACIYKGQELVALFHGLINFINPYYAAFLSDPALFQEIGDPSKDRGTDELKALRIENLRRYPTWGGAPLSACPVRSRAAVRVMSCGLLFLHAHEVAHIVLGHLDLMRDEFHMGTYEELPVGPLSADESNLRRALELQADQSAALTSLHFFRQQRDEDWGSDEFRNADLLWAIAVESLFLLLQLARIRKGACGSATHPSPFARWLNVKLNVHRLAEEHGIHGLEIPDGELSALNQAHDWLIGSGLTEGERILRRDDGDAASDELFSTWEVLRPYERRLEQYRAIRGDRARDHV